mmetsp:Transcript_43069/g.108244  ORF Transcript_43069/g.108244 Transcript_43069/m.108244 type:complete len:202 (+) Transcript_43069:177-782(+)
MHQAKAQCAPLAWPSKPRCKRAECPHDQDGEKRHRACATAVFCCHHTALPVRLPSRVRVAHAVRVLLAAKQGAFLGQVLEEVELRRIGHLVVLPRRGVTEQHPDRLQGVREHLGVVVIQTRAAHVIAEARGRLAAGEQFCDPALRMVLHLRLLCEPLGGRRGRLAFALGLPIRPGRFQAEPTHALEGRPRLDSPRKAIAQE